MSFRLRRSELRDLYDKVVRANGFPEASWPREFLLHHRIDSAATPANLNPMAIKNELIFEVEQEDGTFGAVCHKPEMATQGETLEEFVAMIKDLVRCRFEKDDAQGRWPIRLNFVNDPVLAETNS